MVDQIKALLRLRFVLFKNRLSLTRKFSFVFTVLLAFLFLMVSLGVGVGMYFLPRTLRGEEASWLLMFYVDIYLGLFLLVWVSSLLMEIQRADFVDFRKMLYLPVSLKMVFAMNSLSSVISPMTMFFVFPVLGLTLGLVRDFGMLSWLVLPLAAAFFLMLNSWTYYFRGWLAVLMENKKRRRFLMVFLPFLVFAVAQAPNLMFTATRGLRTQNKSHRGVQTESLQEVLFTVNKIVPVGWFPYGAQALQQRDLSSLSFCFLGLLSLGAIGLVKGYRSTWNYYLGVQTLRKPTSNESKQDKGKRKRRLFALNIPYLQSDTSALTLACFLGYLRHPRVRMQMAVGLFMPLIFLVIFHKGMSDSPKMFAWHGKALPLLLVVLPMLNMSVFVFSVFGNSPREFQAYLLFPIEKRKLIAAKNLALFPFVGGIHLLIVSTGAILLSLSCLEIVNLLIQIVPLYLLFCIGGNFSSIYLPYRIRMETMGRSKSMSGSFLTDLFFLTLVPILLLPSVVCLLIDSFLERFTHYDGFSIGLILSVLYFAGVTLIYLKSLRWAAARLADRQFTVLDKLNKDRH